MSRQSWIYKAHYQGSPSSEFWKAINKPEDDSLYALACVLQEIETRVLSILDELERKRRARKA